jgi:hypothetical protein
MLPPEVLALLRQWCPASAIPEKVRSSFSFHNLCVLGWFPFLVNWNLEASIIKSSPSSFSCFLSGLSSTAKNKPANGLVVQSKSRVGIL